MVEAIATCKAALLWDQGQIWVNEAEVIACALVMLLRLVMKRLPSKRQAQGAQNFEKGLVKEREW